MNIHRESKIMKSSKGFTLIEVIIVVAIIGIMAAISIPAISSWLPNYRLKAAARELYSDMQKIKLEAIKKNTNVGIAFITVVFPATGGSYQAFVDDGAGGGISGNLVQDGAEETLFRTTMPASCSLTSANFSSNSAAGYGPRGLPLRSWFGSAVLRNDRSKWYKLSLSIAGSTKIEISSDGSAGSWN